MSNPFLGEIRIMSFGFPPKGWALANGQFLPINQNQALFSLLGTMYGGNGQTTFALPDMRGQLPVHVGAGFTQGQKVGQIAHTVTQGEMPAHNHFINATTTTGDLNVNSGKLLAVSQTPVYGGAANLTTLSPESITNIGGGQAHENRQPYSVLSFCIALQGIFPSRN